MSNVTLNIEMLQKDFPKTWKDFNEFQLEISEMKDLTHLHFDSLPFEWQLGVYLHYFMDSGIELDISNAGYEHIPGLILEAFKIQENNISHFS